MPVRVLLPSANLLLYCGQILLLKDSELHATAELEVQTPVNSLPLLQRELLH